MKQLIILLTVLFFICSCKKEENCFKSTRVYVEDGFVKQSFENGSVITLTRAGEVYQALDELCQ